MTLRRTGLPVGIGIGIAAFWLAAAPAETGGAIDQAAQSCSPEFDDPASAEYQACSAAIRALSDLHAKAPQDAAILEALLAAERNRAPERAVDLARELLRLAPENALAHEVLAYAAADSSERLAHLERAVAAAPEDPYLHGRLAEALAARGEVSRAVAELKRQLEVNPDAAEVAVRVSDRLAERQETGTRASLLDLALGMAANPYRRCQLAARVGGDLLAGESSERAAFLASCQGYGFYELALRATGDEERGKLLEQAVAASPDHPEANGALAEALLARRPPEVKEALAAFGRQVATNSSIAARRLPQLVTALRGVATPEDEVRALASLLRSEVPAGIVCGPLKSVDVTRHRSEPDLWSLIVGRCGTNF